MIQFSKISTRYAKAIYEYAAENKAETTLYREFRTLAASFLSLPQMRDLLDNPTLEKPKKLAVLQAAAGENISPECLRVLGLIVDNDRVDYAYPIALMYEDIYKKAKNIVSVRLHSASPISDEARKALERLVAQNNQEVDFENRTNERMIGGFVLEIEDLRLDASVSSQLNDIKLGLLRR